MCFLKERFLYKEHFCGKLQIEKNRRFAKKSLIVPKTIEKKRKENCQGNSWMKYWKTKGKYQADVYQIKLQGFSTLVTYLFFFFTESISRTGITIVGRVGAILLNFPLMTSSNLCRNSIVK